MSYNPCLAIDFEAYELKYLVSIYLKKEKRITESRILRNGDAWQRIVAVVSAYLLKWIPYFGANEIHHLSLYTSDLGLRSNIRSFKMLACKENMVVFRRPTEEGSFVLAFRIVYKIKHTVQK